jgi:hypothetical protein
MDIKTISVKATIDSTDSMIVKLPGAGNSEFIKARISGGEPEGLKQVEQGK